MKILLVCQYYYPENFQVTPIAEQLVRDGLDVTVLTGLPNYPIGIVPDEYKKGHRDEYINGVHVIRCFEAGRGKGALKLALNYLSFAVSSCVKLNSMPDDYDVVFCYQLSPVFMALAAKKYARLQNKPFLLYCCDIWPESVKIFVKNESSIIFRIANRISQSIYKAADRIICQSKSFIGYFKRVHGIPESKLGYLPYFADTTYLYEDFSKDNGVTDFVFLGNLGYAQNLFKVLEAVKSIADIPGFRVHFVGDGACLEQMRTYVKENGMEHLVAFHGRQPVEKMPEYYRLADACLVSLKADTEIGFTLPTKVQGYMAAGKPIFGMIEGSAADAIHEAGCGVCVKSDDTVGYAAILKDFVLHSEKYKQMGANGRKYFKENFMKDVIMESLEKELFSLKKN